VCAQPHHWLIQPVRTVTEGHVYGTAFCGCTCVGLSKWRHEPVASDFLNGGTSPLTIYPPKNAFFASHNCQNFMILDFTLVNTSMLTCAILQLLEIQSVLTHTEIHPQILYVFHWGSNPVNACVRAKFCVLGCHVAPSLRAFRISTRCLINRASYYV